LFFIGGVLPDEKLLDHLHDHRQGLNRQRRWLESFTFEEFLKKLAELEHGK